MNKKTYDIPTVKVVTIKSHAMLLAGSPQMRGLSDFDGWAGTSDIDDDAD